MFVFDVYSVQSLLSGQPVLACRTGVIFLRLKGEREALVTRDGRGACFAQASCLENAKKIALVLQA